MCMLTCACAWAEGVRRTRFAALMGVLAVAVLAAVVIGVHHQRTVLDDKVDDPLADLDETPHEWTDEHGAGYDPEQQNVWAEDGAFEPPFVGYAKKDLKWRAPAEPETNALDYLPTVPALNTRPLPATLCTLHLLGPLLEFPASSLTASLQGQFSEPKSMELRSLLGPYPAPTNVWADGVTLDY